MVKFITMSKYIQSIRGMHDLAPQQARAMRWLEGRLIRVLHRYAYQEIRTPLVEKLELFKRSIGEVTDIVEKEMYAFADRDGDWLSLRPGCIISNSGFGMQGLSSAASALKKAAIGSFINSA